MAKLSHDTSEMIIMFIWKKERKKERKTFIQQAHIKLFKKTFICY